MSVTVSVLTKRPNTNGAMPGEVIRLTVTSNKPVVIQTSVQSQENMKDPILLGSRTVNPVAGIAMYEFTAPAIPDHEKDSSWNIVFKVSKSLFEPSTVHYIPLLSS